jgi:hypothetical protein
MARAEPPKPSTAAEMAAKITRGCPRTRVSEGVANARARKLLGRPTAEICQEVAERLRKRLTELHAEAAALVGPSGKPDMKNPRVLEAFSANQRAYFESFFDMCRDMGKGVAGRPVEIVWCSSWVPRPGQPTWWIEPPDELWDAIDGSPFEGINAQKSSRDERLREVIERRLGRDLDQLQVRAGMEGIGFDCGVWTPQGDLDRRITSATPKLNCTGYVSEMAAGPSRGLLLFAMQINVTVKFAESGEPRGWQQIEVKTGEGDL